jgi:anaerobic magnesium-protoporphyrin IX monomethyl ester cyclase
MKVLFVWSIFDAILAAKPLRSMEMHFGLSYISSLLRRHGHDTRLLLLVRRLGNKNWPVIDKYLKNYRPDMICFSAVATEFPFIAAAARYIKSKYREIYLLVGGTHISLNPEEALLEPFDALCLGEGEYPALRVAGQLEQGREPSGIPNLWIKHGSEVEKNGLGDFLADLDALPFADREIYWEWLGEDVIRQPEAEYKLLLGRGCPFNCTYCCNHALRKIAPGKYVRLRSPENILQEIKEIYGKYPNVSNVYLEVETIGANQPWALELCSRLEGFNATLPRPISYGVNLRITPEADYDNLFTAFQKSNFRSVSIGLESGSERVRREILNRKYGNEDVIQAVRLARAKGLKVKFYNLIGLPGETVADFLETVRINRLCSPDSLYTSIFYPYPGTELHRVCLERGYQSKKLDINREEREIAKLNFPDLSRRQIQNCYDWFEYYVYKGKRPTYKLLIRVLFKKLRHSFIMLKLYRGLQGIRLKIILVGTRLKLKLL